MPSSAESGARLGPPASLDALPAEILKLIATFVARQDERIAALRLRVPSNAKWPLDKGLFALSLTGKRLRTATLPFLCKKVRACRRFARNVALS